MSIEFKYFPDVFKDVVDKVRLVIDPIVTAGDPPVTTGGVSPVFRYGSYNELITDTATADNNQQTKYPLVWLVWDSAENTENWSNENFYTISPRVFICARCDVNESTEDAYTNRFKAILYPIWDELQNQLFYHDNLLDYVFNNCKINIHPRWGENYSIKMIDTLSAIEIKFNELTIVNN